MSLQNRKPRGRAVALRRASLVERLFRQEALEESEWSAWAERQPWTIKEGAVISEPGAAIEVTILELSDRAKEACTVKRKR